MKEDCSAVFVTPAGNPGAMLLKTNCFSEATPWPAAENLAALMCECVDLCG